MKIQFAIWQFVLALVITSCSIVIGDSEGKPQTLDIGPSQDSSPLTTHSPLTWAALKLTGRLVYGIVVMNGDVSQFTVKILDLQTGATQTSFTAPEESWVYYTTVSPDGKHLILSYVPPAQPNSGSNQALYIMPLDGSSPPQLLITPPTQYDQYIQAEWSPDGRYIYYVHNNYHDRPAGQIFPHYEVFRMAYPDGQPEKIVENAFWPRPSSDSSRMVYVSLDPVSGTNDLFLANADGSNPQKVVLSGRWTPQIIDAPILTPGGQSILFSAPGPVESFQPDWSDISVGYQITPSAHNVPSDWWSVPVSGGVPVRLTHIQASGLYASISPDQKHIASASSQGLLVMNLDGSNLTRLVSDLAGGTINWIP